MTDAKETWLNTMRPWRPEYVPYADRPDYAKWSERHMVSTGCPAFYIDPEVGCTGVYVLSVADEFSLVQFNIERRPSGDEMSREGQEYRSLLKRHDRWVWKVRTEDLRDTWELARLAAEGRVILIHAGLREVWEGPVKAG